MKQEIVSDGNLVITKTAVPGGHIYNSYDKTCGVLGSCFVPTTPAIAKYADQMYVLLERLETGAADDYEITELLKIINKEGR